MTLPAGAFRAPGSVPTGTPARIRVIRLAVAGLAFIGFLAGLGVLGQHLDADPLADVAAYRQAAVRLNAGEPLYPPGADPDAPTFYRYPPFLAIVLRPAALLLPEPAFAAAWAAAMVVAFAWTVRRLGLRRPRTWLAVGLLGIAIGWSLAIGQAHLLVALLLTVGQPWTIALAANLKLFPAFAAVWWIGRRDWGALAAFLAWMAILALAQWVLEPAGSAAFLGTLSLDQVGAVRNISPYAVSPLLWAGLLVAGTLLAYRLARTRWGWPAAVALATLTPPRLLVYMLTGLLAALREPDPPRGGPDPRQGPDDRQAGSIR